MTPITFAVNFNKHGDLTKRNKAGQVYYDMFLELAEEAETTNDKLSSNYKDISNKWKNYECFTVVFAPKTPFTFNPKYEAVAFSALQTDHFGVKTGRALTRTYYAKSIRKESLAPRKLPNMASRYMLPKQYDYAKRKRFDHIFVSFQSTLIRKNFTTLFTKMLNKEYNKYTNPFPWKSNSWKQLDGQYYTCKIDLEKVKEIILNGATKKELSNINENCWQYIVLNSFNKTPFPLRKKKV